MQKAFKNIVRSTLWCDDINQIIDDITGVSETGDMTRQWYYINSQE